MASENRIIRTLLDVEDLLDGGRRWIQGDESLTADREQCDPRDDAADRWCLLGAVMRCAPDRDVCTDVKIALHPFSALAAVSKLGPNVRTL